MALEYDQQDLALAAELQAALLPESCPDACDNQATAARNRMSSSVGGDFYDFLRINDDQIALVIGDVIGHGVRAALLMTKILGWIRSDVQNRTRPREVIASLNRMLIDLGNRTNTIMSCTMFYAVLDIPSGIVFFVNAGHHRPMLCDREKCAAIPLGSRNMLLGVEDFKPEEDCLTFMSGQRLVLYTDGITDAADVDGNRFGESRLHEIVSSLLDNTVEECADAVFAAVDEFRRGAEQEDDETIVIIDRL